MLLQSGSKKMNHYTAGCDLLIQRCVAIQINNPA